MSTEPPEGFGGVGRQVGPLRQDYGEGWANLVCDRCGASWVGLIDERCGWCIRMFELLVDAHRKVMLRPDLPAVGDVGRDRALRAWMDRLAVAVQSDVVTRVEAECALRREVARDRAA